jgi:hypothetical protein
VYLRLTPSLTLRERYHLRSGDFGSPVLGAPIPSRGRGSDGMMDGACGGVENVEALQDDLAVALDVPYF